MTALEARGIVTRQTRGLEGRLGALAAGHRADLNDRIRRALGSQAGPLGLIVVDLDDFGAVNDWLGFGAGDQALRIVGDRLVGCLREGDTAANLGGDEFAVLIQGADVSAVARRILTEIEAPMSIDGHTVRLRATAGLATASSLEEARQLIQRAGIALHAGKSSARGQVTDFDPTALGATWRRQQLHDELCEALENGEFFMVYQPIVRVSSGGLKGFEALIRWQHPERGVVGPATFVPMAEETGLIIPMSRWILQEACRQLHRWHLQGDSVAAVTMNINVSALHLHTEGFVADVMEAIRESCVDPSRIILEITESAVMADVETSVRHLAALRELGVRTALDDFGTGYSSFGYLRTIPVDILKIDRSFVIELGACPTTGAIVHAIQDLSSCLGMETVAEGAESESQVAELTRLGVTHIQGYYFSKPQLASTVDEHLARWVAPRGMTPATRANEPMSGASGQRRVA